MIAKKMVEAVRGSSVIRQMFQEGKEMAAIYGAENVCDFSLGNPNLAAPEAVKEAIIEVLNEDAPTLVHGYMNNSGYEDVRLTIANSLNRRFETKFNEENIIMTVGAAGGLNVAFKALVNPDDEIVTFAPYFGEYKNYAANVDAKLVVVPPMLPSFMPDLEGLKRAITAKTKMVIINSPNNPTGVVYPECVIQELAKILEDKQNELGTEIYLIADEPYRELVYDKEIEVPFVTKYYNNTIVGYSWSKSLSLPGERIGYLVVPSEIADFEDLTAAINVATRIMGFVNAPSLLQRAVAKCVDLTADIDFYKKNRDMLYDGLTALGYECIKPDGAFYLWLKTPIADDTEFVRMAKKYQLITITGSAFGCAGYVRIVYCVSPETIQTALPKFAELKKDLDNLQA